MSCDHFRISMVLTARLNAAISHLSAESDELGFDMASLRHARQSSRWTSALAASKTSETSAGRAMNRLQASQSRSFDSTELQASAKSVLENGDGFS